MVINAGRVDQPVTEIQALGTRQHPFNGLMEGLEMSKKLTYAEQLKHPKWQKVRLQKLESSNFECDECGDSESTLHVHHKQYFSGRLAWEYEPNELAVLCESCHSREHEHDEVIKRIIANTHSHFSFLTGKNFCNDSVEPNCIANGFNHDPHEFMVGAVAHLITHLNIEQVYMVAKFTVSLCHKNSEARMLFEHDKHFKSLRDYLNKEVSL